MKGISTVVTKIFCLSLLWASVQSVFALTFLLPPVGDDVVGQVNVVTLEDSQTLAEVGADFDIGYLEMVSANKNLSATKALHKGTPVQIPARYILPTLRVGIVVNLAELRVYYFPLNGTEVDTFPIAAGKVGWNTPLGTTEVQSKIANPTWTVPPSIMADSIEKGKRLKSFYSSTDPENPLGHYALYLGIEGLRLHGTLAPRSIGRRASHGCMRLWDSDIEFLYNNVPVGTRVTITHVEDKAGWQNHVLYLQAVSPFDEYYNAHSANEQIALATKDHPATIDWQRVGAAVAEQTGIPVAIGVQKTEDR